MLFRGCIALLALYLTTIPSLCQNSDATSPKDLSQQTASADHPYHQCVCLAGPIFYWNFSDPDGRPFLGELPPPAAKGRPELLVSGGPEFPDYPLFPTANPSLQLDGKSWLAFDDPGDQSPLDFAAGDSISLEAWVLLDSIGDDQQVYVIGKGRTRNDGVPAEQQNYALRIRGSGGLAHPSFLFRSNPEKPDFHRWTSDLGFEADGQWHHVAISFDFGSDQSPTAWVDGRHSSGSWDMGESTFSDPPVMDNDQLWIGSSMGGNSGSSFRGRVDEIAIFRRRLTDREIQERFQCTRPATSLAELPDTELPWNEVVFDVRESVQLNTPWKTDGSRITSQWTQPVAAITGLPRKYLPGGIITDRTNPSVVRMRFRLKTDSLDTLLLIRARSHARLMIDGEVVSELKQASYASDGHEEVPPAPEPLYPEMHPVPAGDQEAVVPVHFEPGEHLIQFEALAGGKNMRVEISETLLAWGSAEHGFEVMSPAVAQPHVTGASVSVAGLDEKSWRQFANFDRLFRRALEQSERLRLDEETARFWNSRHELARSLTQISDNDPFSSNELDALVENGILKAGLEPLAVVDDLTFLRRLTLNTVGVIPADHEIQWYLSQPDATRRSDAVDRFLSDDRWADHWVSYWQDVLAENPGILKPELNNSGPFRWWIYESFLDNKPMDRFATELVLMKGSKLGGGPAGFSMATQNDVPFAERALVLAAAFNAKDMKCARCHDSPVNSFSQHDLFAMAAMLNRSPVKLPGTSTVPPGPNGERSQLITVSLEPGAVISPAWPFADASSGEQDDAWPYLLQTPADTREQLALHLTHPVQSPFAEVIVNRLWERFFGHGLMPLADRWDDAHRENTELLKALSQQHIRDGYDLKKTAAVILKSKTWQRQTAPNDSPLLPLFGALPVRRMSAEQMVDSLYVASGNQFDAEMLTLDPEGRRPDSSFLNLGTPTRAWHFCSLSNERDRPALALPVAQTIYDLLTVFGWRDSRPSSLSSRPMEATVLQPLTLANGSAGHRLTQLSDGAALTDAAIQSESASDLTQRLFLQILTRLPDPDESELISEELGTGFSDRIVADAVVPDQPVIKRNQVSWSNHLNSEATRIKQELELAARAGDPPSVRLAPDWRIRAEDVVWALLNSPEFVFIP